MENQQSAGRAFRHRFEGPFWRRVFLAGLRNIPQRVQRASMPFWASLFWAAVPQARRIIEQNLLQVCGPLSAAQMHVRSLRLFVNYAQAITNMYVLHLGQDLPVEAEFSGHENLKEILAEKRGVIAVTGHMGYWQITPFLMANRKWLPPMTMAMAEEPNQKLADFEVQFRKKLRIVYTTSSPFASIELANILRRGDFVGMQLDRHLGGAHVMLPFCGKPAAFPLGPATLARATGCPMAPVFVLAHEDRRRCTVLVEKPIYVPHTRDRDADVREGMRRVVEVYERYVRNHPEQWFNFHDFWAPPPLQPAQKKAA
ncbi:MAG TPA: lysophospholipid acyltransferase family protein [Kofleriaceae bacterium]|nr:lysophospholipid acyltransferase family protein [Kofleriaceae bacterium]